MKKASIEWRKPAHLLFSLKEFSLMCFALYNHRGDRRWWLCFWVAGRQAAHALCPWFFLGSYSGMGLFPSETHKYYDLKSIFFKKIIIFEFYIFFAWIFNLIKKWIKNIYFDLRIGITWEKKIRPPDIRLIF